jgi:hypothetical protein
MPTVRKVQAEEGSQWQADPIPIPRDRRGITRMEYPQHGSVGWMARVYHNGKTFTRYFADDAHGGPLMALRHAEAWRDQQRSKLPAKPKPHDGMRIVRVDQPRSKLIGWYVYVQVGGQRLRRYLSDAAYGGSAQARQVGEEWARHTLAGSAEPSPGS